MPERSRGRPKGQKYDDSSLLTKVADLLVVSKARSARDAMLKAMATVGKSRKDTALLRRLQERWQDSREEYLAAAEKRVKARMERSVAATYVRDVSGGIANTYVQQLKALEENSLSHKLRKMTEGSTGSQFQEMAALADPFKAELQRIEAMSNPLKKEMQRIEEMSNPLKKEMERIAEMTNPLRNHSVMQELRALEEMGKRFQFPGNF